jgi:hypothetical protein
LRWLGQRFRTPGNRNQKKRTRSQRRCQSAHQTVNELVTYSTDAECQKRTMNAHCTFGKAPDRSDVSYSTSQACERVVPVLSQNPIAESAGSYRSCGPGARKGCHVFASSSTCLQLREPPVRIAFARGVHRHRRCGCSRGPPGVMASMAWLEPIKVDQTGDRGM